MAELRIGILGSGYMGRTHAECITRHMTRAKLIAVAGGRTMGDVQLGYIHDLASGDEWWALQGQGAFFNQRDGSERRLVGAHARGRPRVVGRRTAGATGRSTLG